MSETLLPTRSLASVLDRWVDGADAVPVRTVPLPTRREPARVSVMGTKARTDAVRDYYTYAVRNFPHLYDDAEVDTWLDWRAQVSERTDLWDWDCHACKSAVMTVHDTDPCPRCGHQIDDA